MKIIQIVGFKNSGKTTLATKVIEMLKELGHNVASLKHHGHGGAPIGIENTDSEKHKQAGAIISGVEGDGTLQLTTASWDVEEMIAIYEMMNIEVLVIEGFKKEPFPKVVLINHEEDFSLLEQVKNVQVVITSLSFANPLMYPVFKTSKIDEFYEWLKREF